MEKLGVKDKIFLERQRKTSFSNIIVYLIFIIFLLISVYMFIMAGKLTTIAVDSDFSRLKETMQAKPLQNEACMQAIFLFAEKFKAPMKAILLDLWRWRALCFFFIFLAGIASLGGQYILSRRFLGIINKLLVDKKE
ncbi:MAG: hypothetical protein ABH954_01630 [Candidatus Omnitrophota bacterium]